MLTLAPRRDREEEAQEEGGKTKQRARDKDSECVGEGDRKSRRQRQTAGLQKTCTADQRQRTQ